MTEAVPVKSADEGALAIICGGGTLPFAVADAVIKHGRRVVLFAIRGWADPKRVVDYPHYWAAVGQFGAFCRLARREGCSDVVFIGSMGRPAIWRSGRFKTLRLLPRIFGIFAAATTICSKASPRFSKSTGSASLEHTQSRRKS
jgi:DUF1009 family protein